MAGRFKVADEWVAVTWHAVDRYIERVKPHLTRGEARTEIERVLTLAGEIQDRPAWASEPVGHAARFYVVVADSIAFPASVDGVLLTCAVRAGAGEGRREERAARKAQERERKRTRSRDPYSQKARARERVARVRRAAKYGGGS